MSKVSVIIPVYNSEKYIVKCLDSIINQTLKDIEIICVNDGSTDKSLEILNAYSKKDERIKVLSQENAKQGAARNKGLDIAKGEFITFVDSDDWIDLNYLEVLLKAMEDNNSDLAISVSTRDYPNKIKKHVSIKTLEIVNDINTLLPKFNYDLRVTGKLFRAEILKEIRFIENVFYEDAPYAIRAIFKAKSSVLVPDTTYHYFSNPTSTIKSKLNEKLKNDRVETALDLINFADLHNIKLKDKCILKENHTFWKLKHYQEYKEFYLFGIKLYTKKENFNNQKTFLVFNTACFGDVLLCNPLCQNIKKIFPESKVIFVCNKNFKDAAIYQKCVDEIIVYDKKGEHKGFWGLIKFIKYFKYKKPYASFITYKNEQNFLVAKLLKSRFVFMGGLNKDVIATQLKHIKLLQPLTNKKIINLPMKYDLPVDIKNQAKEFLGDKEYIVLSATSKREAKNIPVSTSIELIQEINRKTNLKVVFVGAGESALKYSKDLKQAGCEFVDLINKTSIPELGAVLKESKCLISVDTGTLHFGCSLNVAAVAVFFEDDHVPLWAPNPELYNSILVDKQQSAENIFKALKTMI